MSTDDTQTPDQARELTKRITELCLGRQSHVVAIALGRCRACMAAAVAFDANMSAEDLRNMLRIFNEIDTILAVKVLAEQRGTTAQPGDEP